MSNKERLLNNPENSILSYFGAALLGSVLSVLFHLSAAGLILKGIGIYLLYMIIITVLDYRCDKLDCKYSCEFNEFWIVLTELLKRKLNS